MPYKQTAPSTEAIRERFRHHQSGEAVFKAILSEEIDWEPFAAFPPSVRLAVVVGQPSEEGPYTVRVKVPHGVKLMPHKHPEDRIYTVISGVFYIGLGDQFDANKLQAYPPGAVIVLPGDTSHFHWAMSGEYITQVTAIGPLGLQYVNPKDDPECTRRLDALCHGVLAWELTRIPTSFATTQSSGSIGLTQSRSMKI